MNNHLNRLFANDAYEVVDDSDQEGAERYIGPLVMLCRRVAK